MKKVWQPEQQQPNEESDEQQACGHGRHARNKQANSGCEGDEGAKVNEEFACGHTGGHRIPQRNEIGMEQAHGSETDHGDGEESMTYTCDAHRHLLQMMLQFIGNSANTSRRVVPVPVAFPDHDEGAHGVVSWGIETAATRYPATRHFRFKWYADQNPPQ
jgi:hypothetical protein